MFYVLLEFIGISCCYSSYLGLFKLVDIGMGLGGEGW